MKPRVPLAKIPGLGSLVLAGGFRILWFLAAVHVGAAWVSLTWAEFLGSSFGVGGGQLAYIDPGLGAMVVQAILGAIFGLLFFFKSLRDKIFGFFRRNQETSSGDDDGSPGQET